jgi:hypothetical protein
VALDRETTALLSAIDDWSSTHRNAANFDDVDRRLTELVRELHPGSTDGDRVSPGQRAAREALATAGEQPDTSTADRREPTDSFREATKKAHAKAAADSGDENDQGASGDHSPPGRREPAAHGKGT